MFPHIGGAVSHQAREREREGGREREVCRSNNSYTYMTQFKPTAELQPFRLGISWACQVSVALSQVPTYENKTVPSLLYFHAYFWLLKYYLPREVLHEIKCQKSLWSHLWSGQLFDVIFFKSKKVIFTLAGSHTHDLYLRYIPIIGR